MSRVRVPSIPPHINSGMAKAPNIGIEVSEIMAAAAMLMEPSKLDGYHNDGFKGLVQFIKEAKLLAGSKKFVFGLGLQTKAMKAFQGQNGKDITNTNPPYDEWLTAAIQGISAAKSTRAWAPIRAVESGTKITSLVCNSVFLTGDSWPSEVSKFKVDAYGFKSYNSSDIVLKFPITKPKGGPGLAYYGISLKKKPSVKSPDPTIINKAFDSVLKSNPQFPKIQKNIADAREKYFARVVREAFTKKTGPLLKLKGKSKLPINDKNLMKINIKDKTDKNKNRKLVDLKGRGGVDLVDTSLKGQSDVSIFGPITSDPKTSMKAYVNSRVASKDSVYSEMVKVVNEYGDVFGEGLLNLVLKKNLYKEIDEHQFAFALITGVGEVNKDGNPKRGLEAVPAKGLYTVLCGLSALNDGGKTKYEVIMNEEANEESKGAKVFMTLMKGKIPVLDLQLRYKGSFAGGTQPQFFATMTFQFVRILKEEYGKKCETP